ncbi:MAG: methyltransferase domain-containing protein [Deltaproteobacteria bacterium]|nr:methyltransferase domain-containing protein [Deltaproteobacteria bacterium]
MMDANEMVDKQYGIGGLLQKIETGLKLAGKDLDFLKVDDLMPVDEFHTRGRKATREMADMVNLYTTARVLDVGCGLGGTARHLAEEYQCSVIGVDLTEEYVTAGTRLTELVGLSERVELRHASALDLPFEDDRFDIVWTQHVQMNIADKNRFFSEIARVLKPGGCFLFHDVFRDSGDAPIYPVPWADDESMSVLVTETEARKIVEDVGLVIEIWDDKIQESVEFFKRVLARIEANGLPPLGIHLLLGDNAEDKLRNYAHNLSENRVSVVVGMARKK